MTSRESLKWQYICAACGVSFEVLYSIFWGGFGHNIPPGAAANLSAHDLAAFYIQNHYSILFGDSVAAVVGILWVPWTAQLCIVLSRIEGVNPVLTIVQLIGGVLTAWVLVFCPAIWVTAAFRVDADPNTIRTLNDMGFIIFNITYMGTSLQAIAAGIVGLHDRNPQPVFPRWVSWWAIFTGLSFLPITGLPFFTTGPLTWNGLITYWILFGTYFVWCASMGVCMVRDTRRRIAAYDSAALSPPGGAGLSTALGHS
jgi:hypothetical protein